MSAVVSVVQGPLRVALAPLAWLLAGVAGAVRRPSVVIAAAVLLVCLPAPLQDPLGVGFVTVPDIVACLGVAAVALKLFSGNGIEDRRGFVPFAALVFSITLATILGTDVLASLRGFVRYAELFVLVPLAAAMSVRDRLDLFLVAGAVVTTTVVEGLVGVYQYFTATGASYAGSYTRAVGTFGAEQIQALGALVGYGMMVTLALALATSGRTRLALLGTTAFLLAPLYFSLSRGAWIATAASVFLMLVLFSWRLVIAIAATALFAVAVLFVVQDPAKPILDERVTSIFSTTEEPDRSVRDRYALWSAAIDIWATKPVTGVGLKDFPNYRDSHAPIDLSAGSDVSNGASDFQREPLLSPHNQYLLVLAEQGLIGITAFGGLLLGIFWTGVRRRKDAGPSTVETRFLDLVAPTVLLWTMIDFAYGDIGAGPTGMVLAILLGVAARRSLIVPKGERP
jgi:O-antigen ligase